MGIKDPSEFFEPSLFRLYLFMQYFTIYIIFIDAVQSSSTESSGDIVKKQEEMFEAMQAQYEVARATTHTMRGVGLGFSSHNKPYWCIFFFLN